MGKREDSNGTLYFEIGRKISELLSKFEGLSDFSQMIGTVIHSSPTGLPGLWTVLQTPVLIPISSVDLPGLWTVHYQHSYSDSYTW